MHGSANGYILEVDGHELAAYWAAPYFVLCQDDPDAASYDAEPWLIHCDDAAHARRCRGSFFRTTLFDSQFEQLGWDRLDERPAALDLLEAA